MLNPGTYTGHVLEICWGTATTGKEQLAVTFDVEGQRMTAYLYFTDAAFDRTIESLRNCGWQGTNLATISTSDLRDAVELVVDSEEYKGKTHTKIRWINKLGGGGVAVQNKMAPEAVRQFASRMQARIKPADPSPPARRDDEPPPISDDDIPF